MILLAALALCSTAAFAQTKIETSAEKVTVFTNGAQVERNTEIDLPAGQSTLVFTGLSPYLDTQSVQVNAKGAFTVLSVKHQFNYLDDPVLNERQQQLQGELKALQKQLKEKDAELAVIASESDLLKTNCSVKDADIAKIKEMNKYYASRMKELKAEEIELFESKETLQKQIEKLQAGIAQQNGVQLDRMSEIVVTVNATEACRSAFNINYYVHNASWYPSYDVRAVNLSEPLTVVYKANVYQNTKEDWRNVRLSLSSSNPVLGNTAPELSTYWLDYPAKYRAAAGNVMAKSLMYMDAAAPAMEEAASMDVAYNQGYTGFEFEIKDCYSVPSNNNAVVAEIGRYQIPATFGYQSAPKLDKDAFLVAKFTDWEKLHLLEGEASVYFENRFVGKSMMNTELSDTLTFSLGRDKQILIDRKKESDKTVRKTVGGSQTQTTGWKISVRNTRFEAVELTLFDQIPVSRNSDIVVTADALGGGELDAATGLVTWTLKLKPGEQRDLTLRYKVKSPKGSELRVE